MKRSGIRRPLTLVLSLGATLLLCGCDGAANQITFLDLVNTVLLGITAAGGFVLLQNA